MGEGKAEGLLFGSECAPARFALAGLTASPGNNSEGATSRRHSKHGRPGSNAPVQQATTAQSHDTVSNFRIAPPHRMQAWQARSEEQGRKRG
jgi:hypothetical protein